MCLLVDDLVQVGTCLWCASRQHGANETKTTCKIVCWTMTMRRKTLAVRNSGLSEEERLLNGRQFVRSLAATDHCHLDDVALNDHWKKA